MIKKQLICLSLALLLFVEKDMYAGKKTSSLLRHIKAQQQFNEIRRAEKELKSPRNPRWHVSSQPDYSCSSIGMLLCLFMIISASPIVLGGANLECTRCMSKFGMGCIDEGCSLLDVRKLCAEKVSLSDIIKIKEEGDALYVTSNNPLEANALRNNFYQCLSLAIMEKNDGYIVGPRGLKWKIKDYFGFGS